MEGAFLQFKSLGSSQLAESEGDLFFNLSGLDSDPDFACARFLERESAVCARALDPEERGVIKAALKRERGVFKAGVRSFNLEKFEVQERVCVLGDAIERKLRELRKSWCIQVDAECVWRGVELRRGVKSLCKAGLEVFQEDFAGFRSAGGKKREHG